jgi:acetate kinase
MDQDHINHLNRIIKEITARATDTYIGGQIEHGGNLWTKQNLIDEAIEENIDSLIYLLTLRDQLKSMEEHINNLETMLAGMQG